MKFEELSEEAQEVAKNMIAFCINNGYQMGMNEGFNRDDTKEGFRVELEQFAPYGKYG